MTEPPHGSEVQCPCVSLLHSPPVQGPLCAARYFTDAPCCRSSLGASLSVLQMSSCASLHLLLAR